MSHPGNPFSQDMQAVGLINQHPVGPSSIADLSRNGLDLGTIHVLAITLIIAVVEIVNARTGQLKPAWHLLYAAGINMTGIITQEFLQRIHLALIHSGDLEDSGSIGIECLSAWRFSEFVQRRGRGTAIQRWLYLNRSWG